MRKTLLASTMLVALPIGVQAQSITSGETGGMQYQVLTPADGCTAANPCGVVVYLGYQNANFDAATAGLKNYFANSNLHAIVIAPTIGQSQDYNVNWGGYAKINTPQQDQMVAVVKGVEAQMGNTVNPASSVVTGGSLGGDGTQAALIAYGPKGIVQPGVFSAGVSFDAATYAAAGNAQDIAALCGVPLTAVHGTADSNQNVSYDQNLASAINSNPACGNSFNFVPVNGAGHGTWGGPSGYNAGTGPGTPLGIIAADLNSAPTPTPIATTTPPPTPTPTPTTPATPATTPEAAVPPTSTPTTQQNAATTSAEQIKPGDGSSVKDCSGNSWAITTGGNITENGKIVPGGGDTSALTMDGSCTVYGLSAGTRNDQKGWFTISSVNPNANQSWNYMGPTATPPTQVATNVTPKSPTPTPTTPPTNPSNPTPPGQTLPDYTFKCQGTTPNYNANQGGFGVIDGQIYAPGGKTPWIARGIDIHDFSLNAAASSLPQQFPGLNMVRVALESLNADPGAYTAAVNALTAQGIVVQFSDYTNTTGNNVGGADGSVFTGGQLAQENAMYAAFAAAYKNNPYVWFGTDNEPATSGGSLSDWHLATYNAIRNAGNNNPILIDPSGSRPAGYGGTPMMSTMNPANYAGMTNIIWDPHVYSYQDGYATDSGSANKEVQAMIQSVQAFKSADGIVPVIIGEYGPAVSPSEPSDAATIAAVQNSQNLGGSGSTAWAYTSAPNLTLVNGSSLTSWGQNVASYTSGSGAQPCAEAPVANPLAGTDTTTASTANDGQVTAANGTTPSQAALPALPAGVQAANTINAAPPPLASQTPGAVLSAGPITAPPLGAASTAMTAPPLGTNSMSISQVAAMATGGH